MEGSGACVLVDEVRSFLSVGQDTSNGVFWGVFELIMIF